MNVRTEWFTRLLGLFRLCGVGILIARVLGVLFARKSSDPILIKWRKIAAAVVIWAGIDELLKQIWLRARDAVTVAEATPGG